jgi:hypothetical protein
MTNAIEAELLSHGFQIEHHVPDAPQGLYILYIQECVCCSDQKPEWDELDEEQQEPEIDYGALSFFVNPDQIDTLEDLSSILGIYSCGGHYSNIRIGYRNNGDIIDITMDILGASNGQRGGIDHYCL